MDTAIADIYITSELDNRPPGTADYLAEKRALQELAKRMIDEPEAVLPKFVDLAMEMTGGISAGLSLYEENPAPGVFRWRYLQGILAPFEQATTPRNFSPCGITLDQNRPVLSTHPERFYGWISDANIVVPEVLLVPLYLGGDEPLGTLWIVSDTEGHFDSGHARMLTELASFVSIALRMVQAEQKLQKTLVEQETLTKEMSHRVKNLFAVTDAMIRISARSTASKEEMTSVLSGRLHALANAHALVRRGFSENGHEPQSSDLATLVGSILRPHEGTVRNQIPRFSISGPSVKLGERALSGMALIIHELATNAAKYGALKSEDGDVTVAWSRQDDRLELRWKERGGPQLESEPASTGFGSKLLRDTVLHQFAGSMTHDWQREGLSAVIGMPMKNLDG